MECKKAVENGQSMPGGEQASEGSRLQSSHFTTSATVPKWMLLPISSQLPVTKILDDSISDHSIA
jgi:hypothetical protein